MIKYKIIILSALALLFSCSSDWGDDLNKRGGMERRYSYEFLGNFNSSIAKESELDNSDSSAIINAPLSLKAGNITAATVDGHICLSNSESIKWKFKIEEMNSKVAAAMCADEKMNIFAVTDMGYLYSLDISGKKRWKVKVDNEKTRFELYSDLLFTNDNVYFSSNSGQIACISADGKILWEKSFEKGITNAIASNEKGDLFFQLSDGIFGGTEKLVMADKKGSIKWEKEFEDFRFFNHPAYYKGKIYSYGQAGSGNDKLSKIFIHDTSGKEVFSMDFPITVRSLSVDNSENIYLTAFNSGVGEEKTGVFKYNSKGEQLWKLYFQAQSVTPVLISENLASFLAYTSEGPGVFFLDVLNGRVKKSVSLGSTASVTSGFTVTSGPELLFPKIDEYGYVRITSLAIDRILPF